MFELNIDEYFQIFDRCTKSIIELRKNYEL